MAYTNIDEVAITRVLWYNKDMSDGIHQCMKQYGYGYEHVAYSQDCGSYSYALLSTEAISLGQEELDIISDYYNGDNDCQYLLDQNGKHLVIKGV